MFPCHFNHKIPNLCDIYISQFLITHMYASLRAHPLRHRIYSCLLEEVFDNCTPCFLISNVHQNSHHLSSNIYMTASTSITGPRRPSSTTVKPLHADARVPTAAQ